jgi:uncharacterized protein (DUF302 family)
MTYYIAKTSSKPFETVVAEVIEALRTQGFGVLTDVDVQNTLRTKIGAQMRKSRILGACNPKLAYEGLQVEDKLGVLLPCNVIVRETPEGQVEVAAVDPVVAMERTGNLMLGPVAEEVRQRLTAAVSAIAA